MTRLQQQFAQACRELKLVLALDRKVRLPSGTQLIVLAHLPSLGSPKGMLVVNSWAALSGAAKELVVEGYGSRCLTGQPQKRMIRRTSSSFFATGDGAAMRPSGPIG